MAPADVVAISDRSLAAFRSEVRSVPADRWEAPRGPGKWSPRQVAEHVALSYEQTRLMEQGTFSGTALPWPMRLVTRWIFLPMLLRRGAWVGGATEGPAFLKPGDGPASEEAVLGRLDRAASALLQDMAATPDGRGPLIQHPVFGTVTLGTIAHFLAIHADHHRPQLTSAD